MTITIIASVKVKEGKMDDAKAALKVHMTKLGKNMAPFQVFLEPGMDMKTCSEIIE